jgi:hypothetical protein
MQPRRKLFFLSAQERISAIGIFRMSPHKTCTMKSIGSSPLTFNAGRTKPLRLIEAPHSRLSGLGPAGSSYYFEGGYGRTYEPSNFFRAR